MNPTISVVMPTYNSGKTIEFALLSLCKQSFDQKKIEILVIDGGSTDETVTIAQKFKARIIKNPKRQPEYAKEIGLTEAKGKYCVFLDSDEVLLNKDSLQAKYDLLEKNAVDNVLIGGLRNPLGYEFINEYLSRIGDPFSFFMYGIDAGDYIKSLNKKFQSKQETSTAVIYHHHNEILPICDSGGHFFRIRPGLVSNIFSSMVHKTRTFAVIKNDYINHYSTQSFSGYLQKIQWRIINAVYHRKSKFYEREAFMKKSFSIKKYFFIPLSLTIVWPLYSAVILVIQNRNYRYLLHLFFSFYTAIFIVIYFVLKIIGAKPAITAYGK